MSLIFSQNSAIFPGRKCHVGSPVGPKNLELEAWSLELGAWSLELGAWSLELGAWSLRVGPGASKIKACRQCKITMFFLPRNGIET